MSQESQFDVEDALSRLEAALELPPTVEDVALQVDQPGPPDVEQPLEAAAEPANETLPEFQEREIRLYGRFPPRPDAIQAEGMNYFSESEDDQGSEPGDINVMTEKSSEPPGDINMTDQSSEPAVDVDHGSEHDANLDQDSELGDIMDLNSKPGDTGLDLESDQSSEQLHEPQLQDRLAAAYEARKSVETSSASRQDVFVPFAGEPSDHFSLTVTPSPLPSSQLSPSTSDLTICESSLEPNLVTRMLPVLDEGGEPGTLFNLPAD